MKTEDTLHSWIEMLKYHAHQSEIATLNETLKFF
jgi:hypothetical protein